ncbi:von Willebrand factor D and EGF domain-containing protein-like [Orbicella faveolata]|nr:von Willebrand factor D and EGF domain-containing protein-like [Orbicella faveolata]
MVKSLRRNFEVHARIWPCWRVVCNCGVAIRENNDVVTIDMCNGAWRRTSPRVVQKSPRPLGNRMRIRRYGSGQSTRFKVMMRSGAVVEAHCAYWGMSLYVTVPGADTSATVGLCGNNNGNPRDDLEGKGIYTFARKYM